MARVLFFIFLGAFPIFVIGQEDTCLYFTELGISFPPVSGEMERAFSIEKLNDLAVKKIRFAEQWSNREPIQGQFNWNPLDDRINWANENDLEILLTIQSNGPDWACSAIQNEQSCVFADNTYFQNYIDSLVQRYAGQIDKIQFGNEWQSEFWYVGGAGDFISAHNILYNSVQTYAPETEVVLGGFTTISLRALAGCDGLVSTFYDDEGTLYDQAFLADYCTGEEFEAGLARVDSVLQYAMHDWVDIHLYDDAEQWPFYKQVIEMRTTKPLLVSEFGGPNINIEDNSDAYQADRIAIYIQTLDEMEISEAYFFRLVEGSQNPAHATSGLIDIETLEEKQSYDVFKSFVSCANNIQVEDGSSRPIVYPNPSSGKLSIQNMNDNFRMLLADTSGRIVYDERNKKTPIDLSTLKDGIYILTIFQDHFSFKERIVLRR